MSDSRQFTRFCAIRRTDPIAADTLLAAAPAREKAAGLKLAGVLQCQLGLGFWLPAVGKATLEK